MHHVFVDMDNVLVDFPSGIEWAKRTGRFTDIKLYEESWDEYPGIFAEMQPLPGAIEAYNHLASDPRLKVFILSTAPWENPSAWSDKLRWVKRFLGDSAHKRLILSHHKELHTGRWLIDDRTANGAGNFNGELIQFGTPKFLTWEPVIEYIDRCLAEEAPPVGRSTGHKNCPFCGGSPEYLPQPEGIKVIRCGICNGQIKQFVKDEAQLWEHWDRRSEA